MTSGKKHSVKVMIAGEEYSVKSDLRPEYTREVAAYVDEELKKVLGSGPLVESHKAAILAALAITDQLFRERRVNEEVARRLDALTEDLSRLIPPAKRQSGPSGVPSS